MKSLEEIEREDIARRAELDRLIKTGEERSPERRVRPTERSNGRQGRPASDLTGTTYGQLVVVSIDRVEGGKSHWLCRCECGTERVVRGANLTSGNTLSCGCRRRVAVKQGFGALSVPRPILDRLRSLASAAGKSMSAIISDLVGGDDEGAPPLGSAA